MLSVGTSVGATYGSGGCCDAAAAALALSGPKPDVIALLSVVHSEQCSTISVCSIYCKLSLQAAPKQFCNTSKGHAGASKYSSGTSAGTSRTSGSGGSQQQLLRQNC